MVELVEIVAGLLVLKPMGCVVVVIGPRGGVVVVIGPRGCVVVVVRPKGGVVVVVGPRGCVVVIVGPIDSVADDVVVLLVVLDCSLLIGVGGLVVPGVGPKLEDIRSDKVVDLRGVVVVDV